MHDPEYHAGDLVRLTDRHKDRRPVMVMGVNEGAVMLAQTRGGYYHWNWIDIERVEGAHIEQVHST